MKKVIDGITDFFKKLMLILIVFFLGSFLRLLVWYFEKTGRIEVIGLENLTWQDWKEGKIVFFSNHPSLLEPVILPIILYFRHKKSLSNPLLYFPWSTPDKKNYFDPWYFSFLKAYIAVPVIRDDKERMLSGLSLRPLIRILKNKGRVIIFPEGTRTLKSKKRTVSEKGNELGEMIPGAIWLALTTKAKYFLIYIRVEGKPFAANSVGFREYLRLLGQLRRESKMIIKVDEPNKFSTTEVEEACQTVSRRFLELADSIKVREN